LSLTSPSLLSRGTRRSTFCRFRLLGLSGSAPSRPPQTNAIDENKEKAHTQENQVLPEEFPVSMKRLSFQKEIDSGTTQHEGSDGVKSPGTPQSQPLPCSLPGGMVGMIAPFNWFHSHWHPEVLLFPRPSSVLTRKQGFGGGGGRLEIQSSIEPSIPWVAAEPATPARVI
jgi:hypothetical protein